MGLPEFLTTGPVPNRMLTKLAGGFSCWSGIFGFLITIFFHGDMFRNVFSVLGMQLTTHTGLQTTCLTINGGLLCAAYKDVPGFSTSEDKCHVAARGWASIWWLLLIIAEILCFVGAAVGGKVTPDRYNVNLQLARVGNLLMCFIAYFTMVAWDSHGPIFGATIDDTCGAKVRAEVATALALSTEADNAFAYGLTWQFFLLSFYFSAIAFILCFTVQVGPEAGVAANMAVEVVEENKAEMENKV